MASWTVRLVGRSDNYGKEVADGYIDFAMPSEEAAEELAVITWKRLIELENGGGIVEIRIERIPDEEIPPEDGGRWANPKASRKWPATHKEVRRCPSSPVATRVGDVAVYRVPGGWAFGGNDNEIAEVFPTWDEAARAVKALVTLSDPIVRTVKIHRFRRTLGIFLTRELRELGLDVGDSVEVAVRPARRGRAGPPPPGRVSGGGAGARPPLMGISINILQLIRENGH